MLRNQAMSRPARANRFAPLGISGVAPSRFLRAEDAVNDPKKYPIEAPTTFVSLFGLNARFLVPAHALLARRAQRGSRPARQRPPDLIRGWP